MFSGSFVYFTAGENEHMGANIKKDSDHRDSRELLLGC